MTQHRCHAELINAHSPPFSANNRAALETFMMKDSIPHRSRRHLRPKDEPQSRFLWRIWFERRQTRLRKILERASPTEALKATA